MTKAPCKDCPDRHLHCHSTCEKYIAYNKECEELRQLKYAYYKKRAEECEAYKRAEKRWRRNNKH